MGDESLNTGEFDLLLELVIAIMFMTVGIVGIVNMSRTLQKQTEVNSTIDKVTVSAVDQKEINPFVYTGYQAYMFAWMMDGHDNTAILWAAKNDDSTAYLTATPSVGATHGNENYILLDPAKESAGFIVKRNRAIIGADEYEDMSVKQTVMHSVDNPSDTSKVVNMYKGLSDVEWKLDLTDNHIKAFTRELLDGDKYLDDTSVTSESAGTVANLFEERKDYIWTLHPCEH